MVRGGFCQRSQFGGMEPAVGIGCGDMNVFGRDDQERPAGGVRERIDFFALADAQRRSAKKKKGDIGAKAGGNVKKAGSFDLLTGELQIPEERRRRVAGAAAQAASCGDFLLENDFDSRANAGFAAQGTDGAVDQIFFDLFLREGFIAPDLQGDAGTARETKFQRVMQPYGLKNGAQFMVTVGALSQHLQTQVHLGVRRNTDCSHSLTQGLASAGGVFCATRCLYWLSFFSTSATLSSSRSAGKERCHSLRDFSHSTTASSMRPCFASTSPKCARMVGSCDSRSRALRSVSSASSSLFCL